MQEKERGTLRYLHERNQLDAQGACLRQRARERTQLETYEGLVVCELCRELDVASHLKRSLSSELREGQRAPDR
jgi:hypothetical protein